MKMTQQGWLVQAFLATLLWSVSKIVLKLGLGIVPPMLLAGVAQTIAFLSLLIYTYWHPIKLSRKFTNSEIHALVWLGVLGFVVAPLLAIIGLTSVAGTTAGLFAALSPIFVMTFGWWILKEKLTLWQILGGLVAFTGAYVFLFRNEFGGTTFGIILIVISELSYALNVVLTRLIMRRPGDDALLVSLSGSFLGALILLPIGLSQGGLVSFSHWQAWLVVVIVGLIFAFAGLIWAQALNYLLAFQAAILQNTMLLQVGLLSFLVLGEKFDWGHLAGGIIVLGGAYLVNRELFKTKHVYHRT